MESVVCIADTWVKIGVLASITVMTLGVYIAYLVCLGESLTSGGISPVDLNASVGLDISVGLGISVGINVSVDLNVPQCIRWSRYIH